MRNPFCEEMIKREKPLRNVLENLFLFKLLDNSSSKKAKLTYPSTTRRIFVLPNVITISLA